MEDYLSLLQLVMLGIGTGKYHTLVNIEQLPEVMSLPFKNKHMWILEVMKGNKMTDVDLFLHGSK
jgi:hypothetical protein